MGSTVGHTDKEIGRHITLEVKGDHQRYLLHQQGYLDESGRVGGGTTEEEELDKESGDCYQADTCNPDASDVPVVSRFQEHFVACDQAELGNKGKHTNGREIYGLFRPGGLLEQLFLSVVPVVQ